MNKKKQGFLQEQSDIHTIVDLPIEAVLEYLLELRARAFQVKILKSSSDEVTFLIKAKRFSGYFVVTAEGCLRRWNGTFTRLDADIQVYKYNPNPLLRPAIILGWVIFIPILLLPLGLSYVALAFFFLFLPASIASIILYGSDKQAIEEKKAKNPHAYRALMKDLESVLGRELKAKAAILYFDGSEQNLTERLQEEKHKHFRLGEDGELDTP